MEIGEFGQPMEFAVSRAEVELKLTPEFATTQHQPMEGQHVLGWLLKVLHVTHNHAVVVSRKKY